MSEKIAAALPAFNELLDKVMGGQTWEVSTKHVALPTGEEAEVALKIQDPITYDRLVVQGFARYRDGRLAGEQHTHMSAASFGGTRGHAHAAVFCSGFKYEDGLYVPYEAGDTALAPVDMDVHERSFAVAVRVLSGLLSSGPAYDVFRNDGAARHAAALNTEDMLLVDPALRQALAERLAETEG